MRAHGTHACYVWGPESGEGRGCRCDACRQARADYERERTRRVAPPYVGADSARQHVRELMAAGVGLKTIAKRAGISHGALTKLLYGDPKRGLVPSKRVRPETRDRILAVMPADAADGAKIDATRTWRHVETLLGRGWTKAAIARAIGQKGPGLQLSRKLVEAGNARKVAALLDQPVPARRDRYGNVTESTWDPEAERREAMARRAAADERAFYRGKARAAERDDEAPVDYELPTLAVDGDLSWMRSAPCRRPEVPVWLFFPGRGDNETLARAKAVCATCPHAAACLDLALATGADGVWGGTTARERRGMRKLEAAS